jgi:hypothetical protein
VQPERSQRRLTPDLRRFGAAGKLPFCGLRYRLFPQISSHSCAYLPLCNEPVKLLYSPEKTVVSAVYICSSHTVGVTGSSPVPPIGPTTAYKELGLREHAPLGQPRETPPSLAGFRLARPPACFQARSLLPHALLFRLESRWRFRHSHGPGRWAAGDQTGVYLIESAPDLPRCGRSARFVSCFLAGRLERPPIAA